MTAIPNGEVSSTKLTTAFGRAGCGMKFYYRYIEGLRGPVTANLLAGIAFDEATRQFHDNLQVGEIVADPRDIFIDKLENPPETNKDGEVVEYDLSAAPDDQELLYGLASIAAAAGQPNVALPPARRLAALNPDNREIQQFLAQLEGAPAR